MPVIIKRPRAKIDLIEIWDYIADDSEVRADAFIDRIDQKFRTLAQRPLIGRLRDEIAHLTEYRRLKKVRKRDKPLAIAHLFSMRHS